MALVMVALPRLPRRPLDPVRRLVPPAPDSVDFSDLINFSDDAIYAVLADLPVSHLVRINTLVSEVTSDQFYAIFNLTQLDIETPTGQLHMAGPPPDRGQYPPDHRSNLRGIPEGPRFPDRSGADAVHRALDANAVPPFTRPSRPAPRSSTAAAPAAPPPARGAARRGWRRLCIFLPATPGPLVRTDAWPYPELFCFEERDLPPWVPRQPPPPRPWSISPSGANCTHDCPARGSRCLRICLRPVMLYSRTEHTGRKCPYCLADGWKSLRPSGPHSTSRSRVALAVLAYTVHASPRLCLYVPSRLRFIRSDLLGPRALAALPARKNSDRCMQLLVLCLLPLPPPPDQAGLDSDVIQVAFCSVCRFFSYSFNVLSGACSVSSAGSSSHSLSWSFRLVPGSRPPTLRLWICPAWIASLSLPSPVPRPCWTCAMVWFPDLFVPGPLCPGPSPVHLWLLRLCRCVLRPRCFHVVPLCFLPRLRQLLPRRGSGPPAHRSVISPKVNAFGDAARAAPFVHSGFFPVSSSERGGLLYGFRGRPRPCTFPQHVL